MFLSQAEIIRRLDDLVVAGDKSLVKEVSYDLSVGDEVYRSEENIPESLSNEHPYAVLRPGQFALVKTHEKVMVPKNLVGLLSIRSQFKFQGLVNVSGFHVDPGWSGHLIFAVQNVGPNDIRLRYRDSVFMMMWAGVDPPHEGVRERTGPDNIPAYMMAQLGGGSITLSQLKSEVDRLGTQVKFFAGVALALLLAMIGVLLRR